MRVLKARIFAFRSKNSELIYCILYEQFSPIAPQSTALDDSYMDKIFTILLLCIIVRLCCMGGLLGLLEHRTVYSSTVP